MIFTVWSIGSRPGVLGAGSRPGVLGAVK